jgi:hypothetical protein
MGYFDNKEDVSASLIKVAAKSLSKANEYINTPNKESEALIIGRCFHEMMEDKRDFLVFDESQRPEPGKTFASKLNKEWKSEMMAKDGDIITLSQFQDLEKMAKNIKASKFYQGLGGTELEGIESEFYHQFNNGNKAKCKPDALYKGADGSLICVDWKTTSDQLTTTSKSAYWAVKKFRYDLQSVHYSEILKEKTGKDVHFFFVFVEKTAPFDVLPVYINPNGELYNDAFIEWNDLLTDLNKCFKTGVWPTLEDSIEQKYISL